MNKIAIVVGIVGFIIAWICPFIAEITVKCALNPELGQNVTKTLMVTGHGIMIVAILLVMIQLVKER